MKILFIGTSSFSAKNFRLNLFKELINRKHEIYCICSDDFYKKQIEETGCTFFMVPFKNRSTNVFAFRYLEKEFYNIIFQVKPDIVFTYQLKPNLIGPLAAKKANIKRIISLNEGLGDAFNSPGFSGFIKKQLAIKLHKKSFSNISHLITLNEQDANFFVKKGIITSDKISVIHGVGVNTSKFTYDPEFPKNKNVLLISRLVKSKGIFDYCKVANEIHSLRSDIEFRLIGPEQELKKKNLNKYINKKDIIYLGEKANVVEDISKSSLVILLSYHEGFGLSLAEAMSIGRPVIAYKNNGTQVVIDDGINGFLVEKYNIDEAKNKILQIIDDDEKLMTMGQNGRKKVEEQFDSKIIDKQFVSIIENIGKQY